MDDCHVLREILEYTDDVYGTQMKVWREIKLGLSTAHRAKHYLTLKKYKILASVVWDKDWYEFAHEAARVAFSAKLNMFCFSSARLGEVTESSAKRGTGKGLHYRVRWDLNSPRPPFFPRSILPEHPMFETTTGLPLVFNPIIFFLAIAPASGAFKHYQTDDQIFALEPPVYDDHLILDWDDTVKDVPVFQATSCNDPTGEIQKACTCSRQLSDAAQRAGFLNCTVHAIRRKGLVKANGAEVFQKYYMAEGGVDGQNSFLNQPLRKDHLESFRGMSMQCNPELWQSLQAQMQYELEEQIDDLTEEIKTADEETSRELQARRHKLHKERQRLTLEELKRRRQNQPRNHQLHSAHEPSRGDYRRKCLV
ncbi:hypothetical protein F5Y03DRAFT_402696 [Xylaria venustula]|nr:hypothetical protein F5Y03DRAFT_402696 [Xylaria venustula]